MGKPGWGQLKKAGGGRWAQFEKGIEEYKEMMLETDWWYNVKPGSPYMTKNQKRQHRKKELQKAEKAKKEIVKPKAKKEVKVNNIAIKEVKAEKQEQHNTKKADFQHPTLPTPKVTSEPEPHSKLPKQHKQEKGTIIPPIATVNQETTEDPPQLKKKGEQKLLQSTVKAANEGAEVNKGKPSGKLEQLKEQKKDKLPIDIKEKSKPDEIKTECIDQQKPTTPIKGENIKPTELKKTDTKLEKLEPQQDSKQPNETNVEAEIREKIPINPIQKDLQNEVCKQLELSKEKEGPKVINKEETPMAQSTTVLPQNHTTQEKKGKQDKKEKRQRKHSKRDSESDKETIAPASKQQSSRSFPTSNIPNLQTSMDLSKPLAQTDISKQQDSTSDLSSKHSYMLSKSSAKVFTDIETPATAAPVTEISKTESSPTTVLGDSSKLVTSTSILLIKDALGSQGSPEISTKEPIKTLTPITEASTEAQSSKSSQNLLQSNATSKIQTSQTVPSKESAKILASSSTPTDMLNTQQPSTLQDILKAGSLSTPKNDSIPQIPPTTILKDQIQEQKQPTITDKDSLVGQKLPATCPTKDTPKMQKSLSKDAPKTHEQTTPEKEVSQPQIPMATESKDLKPQKMPTKEVPKQQKTQTKDTFKQQKPTTKDISKQQKTPIQMEKDSTQTLPQPAVPPQVDPKPQSPMNFHENVKPQHTLPEDSSKSLAPSTHLKDTPKSLPVGIPLKDGSKTSPEITQKGPSKPLSKDTKTQLLAAPTKDSSKPQLPATPAKDASKQQPPVTTNKAALKVQPPVMANKDAPKQKSDPTLLKETSKPQQSQSVPPKAPSPVVTQKETSKPQPLAATPKDSLQLKTPATPTTDAVQPQTYATPLKDASKQQSPATPTIGALNSQPLATLPNEASKLQPVMPNSDTSKSQPLIPTDSTSKQKPAIPKSESETFTGKELPAVLPTLDSQLRTQALPFVPMTQPPKKELLKPTENLPAVSTSDLQAQQNTVPSSVKPPISELLTKPLQPSAPFTTPTEMSPPVPQNETPMTFNKTQSPVPTAQGAQTLFSSAIKGGENISMTFKAQPPTTVYPMMQQKQNADPLASPTGTKVNISTSPPDKSQAKSIISPISQQNKGSEPDSTRVPPQLESSNLHNISNISKKPNAQVFPQMPSTGQHHKKHGSNKMQSNVPQNFNFQIKQPGQLSQVPPMNPTLYTPPTSLPGANQSTMGRTQYNNPLNKGPPRPDMKRGMQPFFPHPRSPSSPIQTQMPMNFQGAQTQTSIPQFAPSQVLPPFYPLGQTDMSGGMPPLMTSFNQGRMQTPNLQAGLNIQPFAPQHTAQSFMAQNKNDADIPNLMDDLM